MSVYGSDYPESLSDESFVIQESRPSSGFLSGQEHRRRGDFGVQGLLGDEFRFLQVFGTDKAAASLALPIAQVMFDVRGKSVKCFGSWEFLEQIDRAGYTLLDSRAFIRNVLEEFFKFSCEANTEWITTIDGTSRTENEDFGFFGSSHGCVLSDSFDRIRHHQYPKSGAKRKLKKFQTLWRGAALSRPRSAFNLPLAPPLHGQRSGF
jgi:hypothetical protein